MRQIPAHVLDDVQDVCDGVPEDLVSVLALTGGCTPIRPPAASPLKAAPLYLG
jgi:hypothetical protein